MQRNVMTSLATGALLLAACFPWLQLHAGSLVPGAHPAQPHDVSGCRCTQIHQCLGRIQRFQDYYHSNRRLQLISDLTPPQQFMENYQNFTAQVMLTGSSCCS